MNPSASAHSTPPQPLGSRGVGISMKPQAESFWITKAPLWLIALSLLTIACCFVLLVIRSVGGNDSAAQTALATNEAPSAVKDPNRQRPREDANFRDRDQTFVVHHDSSRKITEVDKKDAVTLDATTIPAAQPTVLALNSRLPASRSAFLYSAQYQNGIKGTVRLKGEAPPETTIDNINVPCAEPDQKPRTTRFYVVDTKGGLADTLVYLAEGVSSQPFPVPDTPFEFVFTNCLIEPYIGAVMTRQQIFARDASGLMHGLKLTSGSSTTYNRTLQAGDTNRLPNLNPDFFQRLSCDAHPWEFAYVSVLNHPFFAITDEHGEFSITNIPPGRYVVELRHRSGANRGPERERTPVRVTPNGVATVDFELNAASH